MLLTNHELLVVMSDMELYLVFPDQVSDITMTMVVIWYLKKKKKMPYMIISHKLQ